MPDDGNLWLKALRLARQDVHEVRVDGRRILFHIPTTSLFEMDEVGAGVFDLFSERDCVSEPDVRERFDGRFPPERVIETLQDFIDLEVVTETGRGRGDRPPVRIKDYPISTMVLNVNTGCNLSCTYCYKEDLAAPADGERMEFETAVGAFELLLREGTSRDRVNLVFFGGEPLSNMPLIRQVVDYAERRAAEEGKKVDFSLTTNATLLTEALIDYFDAHQFGLTISMDGPKALHDKNRKTVGGRGTYDVVAKKAHMLLERYRSRPIGARVTLTSGVTDVVAIHRHLRDELGFFEVGMAPVTAGDRESFNLSEAELGQVFIGMKVLGHMYLEAALENRNNGFSNMHQLMTDLAEGTRKSLPCGAGLGMLAVDKDGGLNLCHRFTGSGLPTFGDVERGIDKARLGGFLEEAQDRKGRPCETCRIRNLCSGGCYHESYAKFGDPQHPVAHYCELMRDWVDFGINVYTRIMAENPGFFASHIEPRRAMS
ncbi:MAG: quinohemoprotein amine dehydrogenase maturation protein [Rhodospirillales bacterium]|nr:quinohemoprotein amine dehydrogenase maturation protein [Rhodospirillales bacterium]